MSKISLSKMSSSACRSLISRQQQSGISLVSFCKQEGLSKSSYYKIKQLYSSPSVVFSTPLADFSIHPLTISDGPMSINSTIELHYPNGVKLQLTSPINNTSLLELINGYRPCSH